jgi:transcriptional regulator with XRE-family HTH domain
MVGARIKNYLNENGIKQSFLVQKTGLTPSIVSDICNAERRIDVGEYYKICQALNVPLDTFLEDK